MPQMSLSRLAVLLAAGLIFVAGCERDEIHTYTVPKPPKQTTAARVRLLAGLFKIDKEQWFFKLLGPTQEVGQHDQEFMKFLESVRFTGKADQPITHVVPRGWKETGPRDVSRGGVNIRVFNSFAVGDSKKTELTIFRFNTNSPLKDNVDRWCRVDLGRKPPSEEELTECATKFQAGDQTGVRVDLTGPGLKKGGAPHGPMGGGRAVRKPRPLPIKYSTPQGWTETGPRVSSRGGISVEIFTAFDVDTGRKAETTVQVFPKAFGNWAWNVNRWRREIGLAELSPAEADRAKEKTISVAGIASPYLDLAGAQKRSLVVVLTRGERAWFFKLLGDKNVVSENKSKFESFVQSVKFTGAADE